MEPETAHCPVCGLDDARGFLTATDTNLFTPGTFRLVRCSDCSLVYVNPRPRPEAMSVHYPSHYWASPPTAGSRPYLDTGMRRTLAALTRDYPGGRVLDVGCAVGNMPAHMRTLGLDAVGLEPYEHAARLAREHYGLDVVCAFLQEADLPEASFDAVTFFDVLEHVHDPVGDLRTAHSLLKPGGSVFVKVPNIAALQARLFGRWWYWLDTPRHLVHFSPRSLARALREAGFSDVRSQAIPDSQGAMVFQTSLIYWLRGLQLARRGVRLQPAPGQTVGEALDGQVYAAVPSLGKKVFRWLAKYVLYAPLAFENLIGRSVELLGTGRKR